ncbi:MAG TPA: response regulator [Polyangiaceae bacterium]|nr:response regulator [Polyangiaceae bacterium]
MRLLVVAADDQTRRTTARLLRSCTAGEVLEASTSREALDATLNGSVPDVLLLDTQLAIPSAAETCRQLRAQKSLAQPVIWLLAPAGASTPVIEALEAGADDCLGLPVAPHLLEARLRVTLRRRERARGPSRFVEALLAAQTEGSGELVVRETRSRRAGRVYFYDGRVVWVHVMGETSALNEVLSGVAALDEKTERAVLDASRRGTPLSHALERAGVIERGRWRSAVQAWSRQRLQTLASFAPASSVFLPHEFRLEDDISFTVAELLGDIDSSEPGLELAAPLPSDGYAGVLSPPERPDPEVETVLSACMESGLVQSVAVLERGTGQCLGARGETLDALAVWTNLNHVNAVVAREGFDSFAVTTKLEHQLTVPLSGQPGWVVHASYSRARGPLGVAFTDLRFALSQLNQRVLQS